MTIWGDIGPQPQNVPVLHKSARTAAVQRSPRLRRWNPLRAMRYRLALAVRRDRQNTKLLDLPRRR